MKSVLLNKRNLEIAKLAPKDESRYTLNAVQVTADETVVTNGHYLVRVNTPQTKVEHFPVVPGDAPTVEVASLLMPTDAALETLKVLPKKTTIPVLNHAKVGMGEADDVRATVTDLDIHRPMSFRKVTEQFPNWKEVIPKSEPKFEIHVDGKYLSDLLKLAATYQERSHCVRLRFWDAQSALQMDATDDETGQTFTAILMPMRGSVKGAFDVEQAPVPCPFADVPEPEEQAIA